MSLQKELEDQIKECKIHLIVMGAFSSIGLIVTVILLITGCHWLWVASVSISVFMACCDLEKIQKKWDNLKIELEKAKENDFSHKYCSKCGSVIPNGKNFCVECGEHLPEVRKCAKCGTVIPAGKIFVWSAGNICEKLESNSLSMKTGDLPG